MVFMKRKFTKEDLKELVTNKDNCVKQVKNGITHLSIHPSGLGNVLESVKEVLNQKITKYDQKLGGILLHYKHLKMLTNSSGRMYHYSPMIQVNIQATFYIFSPEVGQKIQATVIKKNTDHLGCMAHKLFNISVPKPANSIGNKWRGNHVKIGQTVLVEITLVDCNNTIPYIRGNLIESSVDEQLNAEPMEDVNDTGDNNVSTETKHKKHKKKKPFDMNVVNGHAAEHLKVFQQESKPKAKQRVSFAIIDSPKKDVVENSSPKKKVKTPKKSQEQSKSSDIDKLISQVERELSPSESEITASVQHSSAYDSSPKKKPKTPKKSRKDTSSDIDKLISQVTREFSQSESEITAINQHSSVSGSSPKKKVKTQKNSQENSKSSDIDKLISQVEREFSQSESEPTAITQHSSVFDSSGTKERKKKAKKDKSREKTSQLDLDTQVEQLVEQRNSKNDTITSEKFVKLVEKSPKQKAKSPKKSISSENIAKYDAKTESQRSFDIEQLLKQAEQDVSSENSSKKLANKSKKNKSKEKARDNDDEFDNFTDTLLQSLSEAETSKTSTSKKRKRSKSIADADISDLLAEAASELPELSKEKRKKRRHNDLDATFNGNDQSLPSSQIGTPLFSSTIITESRKSAKKSKQKRNDDNFLDDILSKYL